MRPGAPDLREPCPTCAAPAGESCKDWLGKPWLRKVHYDRPGAQRPWWAPRIPSARTPAPEVAELPPPRRPWRPTFIEPRVFVYLIETAEPPARVKVGIATDLRSRLSAIQTGSPLRLRLRAAWAGCTSDMEGEVHRLVEDHWVHGEWFDAAAIPQIEQFLDARKPRATLPVRTTAAQPSESGSVPELSAGER